MTHAITYLQQTLQALECNEPINRAAGNIEQADLEAASSKDIRTAIAVLQSTPAQ